MNTRKVTRTALDRVWRIFLLVAFLGGMLAQPTSTVHAFGPMLIVHPNENAVEVIAWQQFTTVSAIVVREDLPQGFPVEAEVIELIDGIPYLLLDFTGNVDIQPGDHIIAFDDLGDHVYMQDTWVTDVAIAGYDLDADTVNGTAAPGSYLTVNIWNGPDPAHGAGMCGYRNTFAADPSGEWSVDLGDSIDPFENCDLAAGLWVTADQPELVLPHDGDSTRVIMELTGASGPMPVFTVRPNEEV